MVVEDGGTQQGRLSVRCRWEQERSMARNRVVYQYDVGGREGEEEMEATPGFILYDAEVCNCVDVRCGGVRGFQISNART